MGSRKLIGLISRASGRGEGKGQTRMNHYPHGLWLLGKSRRRENRVSRRGNYHSGRNCPRNQQ